MSPPAARTPLKTRAGRDVGPELALSNSFPATDVALEGFRLTRENPRSVAVWAGIRAVYALLALSVINRFAGDQLTAFLEAMKHVENLNDLSAKAAPLREIFLAFAVLDLAVQSVLSAACFRTVLGPRSSGRFQLALGLDELRLFALNALAVLASFVALTIALVIGDLIAAVAASAGPVGALLQAIYGSSVFCFGMYVALRLSLTPAMTFALGHVAIQESWKATEGRAMTLAGAYLMAAGLAGLVYVLGFVIGASTEAFDAKAVSNWASWGALVSAAWMAGIGALIAVIITAPGAVASRLLATRAVDRA